MVDRNLGKIDGTPKILHYKSCDEKAAPSAPQDKMLTTQGSQGYPQMPITQGSQGYSQMPASQGTQGYYQMPASQGTQAYNQMQAFQGSQGFNQMPASQSSQEYAALSKYITPLSGPNLGTSTNVSAEETMDQSSLFPSAGDNTASLFGNAANPFGEVFTSPTANDLGGAGGLTSFQGFSF